MSEDEDKFKVLDWTKSFLNENKTFENKDETSALLHRLAHNCNEIKKRLTRKR